MQRPTSLLFLFCATLSLSAAPVVDLNTPREFPEIKTEAEWKARAQTIREQILVSAGLWPMPEKTPLHAKIFDKIDRGSYSIEKVYFQSYPGFYVAGNLYRPLGKGRGPFPAILNPHGHWEDGRLADTTNGSIPGRCINFARQGMIAFSYDMVGYNDTHFADSPANAPYYKTHRDFQTNNPASLLWGISLMGLQTWDSIRALDFLASLPDADPHRLAVTGESGGGTQTMLLGAIDERLAAQAPVVMVSHSMQGGCLCENMPGLRVEFSNMEIAAAAAPRPQIMVGASGDWTKTMMTVEGPSVRHIYDLLHAPENLRYVRFDFPHNYNQTSREAVYQWFDKVLLKRHDEPVREIPFQKEPDQDLRVFADNRLPPDALTQQQLVDSLIKMHQQQLKALQPKDKKSLERYKETMQPALERILQLKYSPRILGWDPVPKFKTNGDSTKPAYVGEEEQARLESETNRLTVLHFALTDTNRPAPEKLVVLVDSKGRNAFCEDSGAAKGLALELLRKNIDVAIVESIPGLPQSDESSIFFNTYNSTWLQSEVRDLITMVHSSGSWPWRWPGQNTPQIILCGNGRAGLWCLLAAPTIKSMYGSEPLAAILADCDQLDVSDDQNLLAPDLFCPGLRNVDTFNGALTLAAPRPLLLHNTAGHFPTDSLKATYKILGAPDKFRAETNKLSDEQIVEWISKFSAAK